MPDRLNPRLYKSASNMVKSVNFTPNRYRSLASSAIQTHSWRSLRYLVLADCVHARNIPSKSTCYNVPYYPTGHAVK